jgi:hypothetical protein
MIIKPRKLNALRQEIAGITVMLRASIVKTLKTRYLASFLGSGDRKWFLD